MLEFLAAAAIAAAGAPATGKQALYDQAQAAFDANDYRAAVEGFRRLLLPDGRASRTDGVIRARYADALSHIGDEEAALSEIDRAIGELPPGDRELGTAYLTQGNIFRASLAMDEAIAAYEKARPNLSQNDAGVADMSMMLAALVFKPELTIAGADRLADNSALASLPALSRAQLLAYAALAKLTLGDARGALPYIRRAANESGSLDTHVSLAQARVRGAAALVYLRNHDDSSAKKYLAYSGGGYLPSLSWLNDESNELPVCDDSVHPDDVAVVEIAIDPDGKVVSALPLYANRPGPLGLIFARMALGWHYDRAAVQKLSPFWRGAVQLAMRCVTRPQPQALSAPFAKAAHAWLATHDLPMRRGGRTDAVPEQREEIARSFDPDRIDAALAAADAPADVRAFFLVRMRDTRSQAFADAVPRVAALPGGARAAAWMALESALARESHGGFDQARPWLDRVVHTPTADLAGNDPIRQVAILHLSMVDRQQGDAAAAQNRIAAAGLGADQCQMFDVRPIMTGNGFHSGTFPMEALRWGFEGMARESFDIDASGRVNGVRTILSYPPFVFEEATQKTMPTVRYAAPSIDGKALGCSASTLNVNYHIPGRPTS